MTMAGGWREELAVVAVSSLLLVYLGLVAGHLVTLLWMGATLYLGWHFYQLVRFSFWLKNAKHSPRPHAWGLWRDLVNGVEELRDKGRKRKRKLSRMLSGFLESTGALPDATLIINDEGQLDWWNSVAAELFGLERKQDKGDRIEGRIKDPVFLAYLHGGDYSRPLQMPAPVNDGVSLEVRIVPYGKGKRLLQARDITRLSQLEIVRRDFVANVSHEMRTPLTVVHGYLEMLQDSPADGLADWKAIFDTMQLQTSRMQHIVEDLLLLSRLEARDTVEHQDVVKMYPLLKAVLGEARQLSGEQGHKIELEADEGLCLVGSGKELESAFSNLVFNAVRYTPAGGRIKIRWWLCGPGPCFSVADSGIGIDPVHLPRLTERFYRVDVGRSRDSGGTGLGLAIVKHVLSRHDGHLEIESRPGKGSRFICHFAHDRVPA